MKIAVLGAGGVRTPLIVQATLAAFAQRTAALVADRVAAKLAA